MAIPKKVRIDGKCMAIGWEMLVGWELIYSMAISGSD